MLAKTPEEMGENIETFLDALNAFERKPSREIPSELEQLLCRIARNGEPLFPWSKLKPLMVTKLENVIQEYIQSNPCEEVPMLPNVENVKFDDMRERLLRALNAFNSAPFTMQRLCELLTHPKRYYQRSDKFMRGVEKNVQVVSTVTPTGKRITHSCEVRNCNLMMNGIPSDTYTQTSTPSSETQASGEPASSDETNHAIGNGATGPQQHDAAVAPAQEQSVDSTRQTADPTASELVVDTSERTTCTSGDDSSPTNEGDGESKETPLDNEADACKPMEVADQTAAGDSDDSDGNKGDPDQDSCSSMDSADSGDSSPDSALPPRTGYFDSLPPKDSDAATTPSPEQKGSELVESTADTEEFPTEDKPTSEAGSKLTPDQSHSSIPPPPAQEQQASPLVTSAATAMRTDQSEEASESTSEAKTSAEASADQAESSTGKVDQSDSTSEGVAVEAETPMEHE